MSQNRRTLDRTLTWAELAGFLAAAATIVYLELQRHPEFIDQPLSILAYSPNPETTWVGLALLTAPLVWRFAGRTHATTSTEANPSAIPTPSPESTSTIPNSPSTKLAAAWFLCVCLSVLHVGLTWWVGRSFHGMPPAYHDEYSYLFQAKTFLAGRLYFPQHPLPEFFDQMHVLNDHGVFASRYFPGVGLWLMPWVAMGGPHWGQYMAGGLITAFVFWIGWVLCAGTLSVAGNSDRQPSFNGLSVGLLAGLACAVSPAMLLFGNLLLSHHPTMLGLAAFVLCYLKTLRNESHFWPLAGGIALSFAMLCRPLTAFGFSLPFAGYAIFLSIQGHEPRIRSKFLTAVAPLVVGVALLAAYNTALTGSPTRSPYRLYTQIYTPNHGYGFHNVTRGSQHGGPKVLENYNRWSEELTLPRALHLLTRRMDTSALWSIGRIGLAWLVAVFVVALPRLPVGWKLLAGSLVGLHAVYFPFGFEGIFELSYVFESVPILCLLTAGTFMLLKWRWTTRGRWMRIVWLASFLILGFAGPLLRLKDGILEVRFPRGYYADFEQKLHWSSVRPPALIFIDPDPADRHRDLVTNSPSLDDPILRARANVGRENELIRMYPDRKAWYYDARTGRLARIQISEEHPATPTNP